jgi:hypothetical protein
MPEDINTRARQPTPPPSAASDAALQHALADAVTAYGRRVRDHGELPPFPGDADITPTDVALTAAAMLKAADVNSFEIAALFNV